MTPCPGPSILCHFATSWLISRHRMDYSLVFLLHDKSADLQAQIIKFLAVTSYVCF